MPNSQTIWNAILTVIGAALLAALGFLYNEVINLKEIAAKVDATRFTEEEASDLRSDLTVTLTTIDKRLAIMENNNEWIRIWVTSGKTSNQQDFDESPSPPSPPAAPAAPAPASEATPEPQDNQQQQQKPRYDLRKKANR